MSLQTSEDLPICSACGTQFSTAPKSCRICDDPRQYVPPTGQTWTSLSQLRHSPHQYRNTFTPSTSPDALPYTTIETTPKFGIGQRAFLLPTASGANILWDCIAYLDRETVDFIRSRGGLEAIVISHPHYYTTHLDWARTFDCPVWIAAEDAGWVCRGEDDYGEGRRRRRLMREGRMSLGGGGPGGVEIVKVGGHFPGSLVAVWRTALLIADSLVTTPSGLYFIDRPPGTISFAFMWSIPNMIPLPPDEIHKIWKALKPLQFESTHGAFAGLDIMDKNVKARILESMKIQTRNEGWKTASILEETM